MANELTTLEYAAVLDSNDSALSPAAYSASSSDPAVAAVSTIGLGGGAYIVVNGIGVGTATITVTRNVDGATASLDATVTGGDGFTIHLGTPAPR